MKEYLKSIEILPYGENNIMNWERENSKTHTSYETETMLYSCIMHGDDETLSLLLDKIFSSGIVAGRLSNDSLRQMKYWAVSCVTIGTRYAIQGGLPEMDAYNMSDAAIRHIDLCSDENEIVSYIVEKSHELAKAVKSIKLKYRYPASIRKCVSYIDKNLHSKIKLTQLAEASGLSKDYLSQLFKKTTGVTVSDYIKKRRLSASKQLLDSGISISETAYRLGFCSESYFISCFKKEYGMTVREYLISKGKV